MTEAEKLFRDARAAERDRVLLGATIVCSEGSQPDRVRDLSSTGAHVISGRALPSEVDAIFQRGELFPAARIIWASDTEAGLEFYRELK